MARPRFLGGLVDRFIQNVERIEEPLPRRAAHHRPFCELDAALLDRQQAADQVAAING